VDVVIGLTHVGHRVDQQLAEKVSGLNIILGGHSHTVLQCPVQVGNAWIAQGGSHGRFAGVYEWNGEQLSGELSPLP
jgi:2',3'-cyclic-nucleotide 2'-phosphodiesterase (5'-nucleotidase family)